MGDLVSLLFVATGMGLSIFLSWPVIFSRRAQGRWAVFLTAGAIGILIFLLADLFADDAPILYPSGYVANPGYSLAFGVAFLAAFAGLWAFDRSFARDPTSAAPTSPPTRTALIVAIGIGLQNLTEGLVFGANWQAGALGILAVVFVGFFLQNMTEGFPILSPFLAAGERPGIAPMAGLLLLAGLPTILGSAIGFYGSSTLLFTSFDALAIGAIAYVILPMLRAAFRPLESRALSLRRDQIVYAGVLVGFLVGFAVNAL